MKAMRVRVPDDVAAAIAAEAVDPVSEAEVVRTALRFYFNFRELIGSVTAPQRPLNGPASTFEGGSATAPQRPRAIGNGLILPVEESQGGAVTAPQRPLNGPAPSRARERENSRDPDPDPDPEEDPEEEADPPDLRAGLSEAQRAVAAVADLFRRCGHSPPEPVVIGFWRREAGGTEPLLAVVREVAAKGRLTGAADPQAFLFACIRRAAADRRQAAAAAARGEAKARLRRQLEHTRGYLHGPEEQRPYHEQELRAASGVEPLCWSPPTVRDLEQLEAQVYASEPNASGAR